MTLTTPVSTAPAGREPVDRSGPGRRGGGVLGRPLPAHWPLSFLVLGFPLWWVLGVADVMPVLLAAPLAWQLLRSRDLPVPRGFGWWLLFLAWVCLGVLVLWADAPGAVPGGDATRFLVFGYRLAWYVTVTVWLLWLLDTSRDRLPDRTVHRLVGGLLVLSLAGGVLALLAPQLEFRSALEYLLPGSLTSNFFVESLVHPAASDIQTFLGEDPVARPKAPFAFTNTWGSVVSLTLVFAVAALVRSGGRARTAWMALLLFAPVPVLLSLNRGLWAALVLGAAGVVVLLAVRGRLRLVAGIVGVLALVALILAQTPLGQVPAERFGAQHSNERRGNLTEATVESVSVGSPIVGFGNTRDVQGTFSSIAGGGTPDCPACELPPLGTQGQGWLILFAQGWVGLFLFGAFMLGQLWRSIRCRTLNETICAFVLAIYVMQLVVYDTMGLPMLIAFLAIGLVTRERRDAPGGPHRPSARSLAARVRPALAPGLALVLLGGAAGLGYALLRDEPEWRATTKVLLHTPADVDAGTALLPGPQGPGTMTIDTEARLIEALPEQGPAGPGTGADSVDVTATPNTRVLEVTVTSADRGDAEQASRETVATWLQMRRQQAAMEHGQMLQRFDQMSEQLTTADWGSSAGEALPDSTETTDRYIAAATARMAVATTSAGEVIASGPAERQGREIAVPVASGLGLGLLAAALLTLRRPRPRPHHRRIT